MVIARACHPAPLGVAASLIPVHMLDDQGRRLSGETLMAWQSFETGVHGEEQIDPDFGQGFLGRSRRVSAIPQGPGLKVVMGPVPFNSFGKPQGVKSAGAETIQYKFTLWIKSFQ